VWELRRGGGARDERSSDLQLMGITPERALAWLAEQDEAPPALDGQAGDERPGDPLHIWPENWPALRVWMRLQTQWHQSPTGRLAGLRYPEAERQVQRLMPGASQAQQDQVFEHLQDMELAALEALDDRSS